MPQQSFLNAGIMPNDNVDFTFSNINVTQEQIQNASNSVRATAYDTNIMTNLVVSDTVSSRIEGLTTAALMLAQYYIQQVTYQGADGYGSAANPVEPAWSENVKALFARSLGPDPDKESLFSTYEWNSCNIDGVNNTFFNLGMGKNAFTWEANGNLTISDTYLFTGFDDLGAAPTYNQLSTPAGYLTYAFKLFSALALGTPLVILAALRGNNLIEKMLYLTGGIDPTVPFNLSRYTEVYGINVTNIGLIEPMKFRTTFTPQELYDYNPALFWAAVKQGLIPFSALLAMPDFICNSIEVGAGPTAFLPNFGQVNADIGTNPNNWTFGGGGNYPRPFTSFSQRIVEATYSLGPFAMLDYANPTTGTSTRISGRIANLGVVCPESSSGDTGFIRQNWYGADTGGTGYGSNLLKWQWWEQCVKTKHTFPYGHLPGHPDVTIEVATASYAVGNAANFTPDLPAPEDFTLLLGVVLAAGALGAIL